MITTISGRPCGKPREDPLSPSSGHRPGGLGSVDLVAPIHPKATVTILDESDWDRWLTGNYDEVAALQRPHPAERMTVRGPLFPTRT